MARGCCYVCIAQSLKAIQSAVATSARENTAAAAQEAQHLLQGGSRRPRKHSLQANRTKKRKRHAVRSRNSYVDAVLNDEEVRSVRHTKLSARLRELALHVCQIICVSVVGLYLMLRSFRMVETTTQTSKIGLSSNEVGATSSSK